MSEAHRAAARARLEALLLRDEVPLDEAVACFGVEEDPRVDVDEVLASLDALASGLWLPDEEPGPVRAARLVHHLHHSLGFEGDTEGYDEPANSVLHAVIARRAGLPIVLSVVWCEVARRAGFPLDGVGFPGHFLVAPRGVEPRYFLDPFDGGEVLSETRLTGRLRGMGWPVSRDAEALAAVDTRKILVRMGHNLRRSYAARGRTADVARVEARIVLVETLGPGLAG